MNHKESTDTSLFQEKYLLFSVFITGASVLAIEVIANRILSPYFGNTIYSVSSILGVVLAALSFGYYFGGKYADKYPSEEKFYIIIFLSGLSVLLIKILGVMILPYFANNLSITTGPLIASLILFLIPSFLMGLLSPFAIKLHSIKHKNEGIGKTSGEVFFISTLGSIFGSFLSGFYLIPNYGISKILFSIGLMLVILGLIGLNVVKKNSIQIKLIFAGVFAGLLGYLTEENYLNNVIYIKDGVYERILVFDAKTANEPTRYLLLDRSAASGKYLNKPNELAFNYSRYVDIFQYLDLKPKTFLFIGGGAYSMPNYILENYKEVQIDVAEIEPELLNIAKRYFDLKDDGRIENKVIDGRKLLSKNDKNYDLIFSDVYSSVYSIPVQFTTKEYFELVKRRLNDNGIALLNIISDLYSDDPSLLFSEIKTFKEVFEETLVFKVKTSDKSVDNFVIIGFKNIDANNFNKLVDRFNKGEIVVNTEDKLIDLTNYDLTNQLIMTDDYAPVEYLTAELLKRSDN